MTDRDPQAYEGIEVNRATAVQMTIPWRDLVELLRDAGYHIPDPDDAQPRMEIATKEDPRLRMVWHVRTS